MVGTFGNCGTRLAELIASACTLPVTLRSVDDGIGAKYICTSPRTTAVTASGAPRNGTCWILIFACCRKISAERNDVLATPAEEKLSVPGFCCAIVTKSLRVRTGR